MLRSECSRDFFSVVFFSFGNPVMEAPVGLPVVAQTEGGGFQMEGGVTAGAILVMED